MKGLTEDKKDPRRYSKSSESHFKIWDVGDTIIAVRLLQWPVWRRGFEGGSLEIGQERRLLAVFQVHWGAYALCTGYETGAVAGTGMRRGHYPNECQGMILGDDRGLLLKTVAVRIESLGHT